MIKNQIFISYAHEDEEIALKIYNSLSEIGFNPWMDKKSLLPGEKWQQVIEREIKRSLYFIAIISKNSMTRRGHVQKELKTAFEILDELPDENIFIIPVRIENCIIEDMKLSILHYVDVFPSWEVGFQKIIETIQHGLKDPYRNQRITATAPSPTSNFIGREDLITSIVKEIIENDNNNRIIAFVGMGGIGKTTLASKICSELHSFFSGGIFWNELTTHQGNPMTILSTWARLCSYDVTQINSIEQRISIVRGIITEHIKINGRILIVFDDIQEEWYEDFSLLLSAIPSTVPILITSRNFELAVNFCDKIINLDVLTADESYNLLYRLAGEIIKQDKELSIRVAKKLGFLPLAIELIGRLINLKRFKPGWRLINIYEELTKNNIILSLNFNDKIMSCFSISYDFLETEYQHLFSLLGMFANCPLASENISCVASLDHKKTEEMLDKLVSFSLLNYWHIEMKKQKYILHPLLYEYSLELIRKYSENEYIKLCNTYSRSYAIFSKRHEEPTAKNFDILESEYPNLCKAFEYSYSNKNLNILFDLIYSLHEFLIAFGYWKEYENWLSDTLKLYIEKSNEKAILLYLYSSLNMRKNDYEKAYQLCNESIDIFKLIQDNSWLSKCYCIIGNIYRVRSKYKMAINTFNNALSLLSNIKSPSSTKADALRGKGDVYFAIGQYSEARNAYETSIKMYQTDNNKVELSKTHAFLGDVYRLLNQIESAEKMCKKGLYIARELRYLNYESMIIRRLGHVFLWKHQYEKAEKCYRKASDIDEKLGCQFGFAIALDGLSKVFEGYGKIEKYLEYKNKAESIYAKIGFDCSKHHAMIALREFKVK